MRYAVRRCDASDIAGWARLRHALWPDSSVDDHAAEIAAAMPGAILRGWLACGEGGEAVGFAEVSIRRYANGSTQSPVPFLEGIWVAPEHRRHGAGGLLIDAICADCAAEGYIELCSDADIANLRSHQAHRSWGFAETERVVYFRKGF